MINPNTGMKVDEEWNERVEFIIMVKDAEITRLEEENNKLRAQVNRLLERLEEIAEYMGQARSSLETCLTRWAYKALRKEKIEIQGEKYE